MEFTLVGFMYFFVLEVTADAEPVTRHSYDCAK